MKHWPLLLIAIPFLLCIALTIYATTYNYHQTRLAEKSDDALHYMYASQDWLEENPLRCNATKEEVVSSLQEMERRIKINRYSAELIIHVSQVKDKVEILLIYPGPDGRANFFTEDEYRRSGDGVVVSGGEAGICFQVKCQ